MDFDGIKQLLSGQFGEQVIISENRAGLQPVLEIEPSMISPVCKVLRDHPDTYFDFLSCLSAVDHHPAEMKFSVVYHLASIPYKTQLSLKVIRLHDRENPELPSFQSVSAVWKSAEWHEREAYDLLGVHFEGNPDLRRILLPDDWEGFPLRKDYVPADEYKGIKIS